MSEITQNTIQKNSKQGVFNPFPGLRPFSIEESHLFFGREGQSEEVLDHLSGNRFVAVIGSSGSGKSSLMYCGVIPVLYGGFIADAGSKWRIITSRPGNSPIENLATAIVKNEKDENDQLDEEVRTSITYAVLNRSSKGLIEALQQTNISKDENVLVVVDQFEELFRFKRSQAEEDESVNESESFVKLLVEAARQQNAPIYVVITMRSDFIGDCAQFQELTELINESNYLVPQMTREDFRKAITGPVAVGGAKIDNHLVQQLLNEVSDNPDQLPILQHALMRTWDYWITQGDHGRPVSMNEYDAIGRMERALSDHANEAFDELDAEGKVVCESIFKTITEKGADNRGIRHPTGVKIIAEIARSTPDKVIEVVERFRMVGRSFITPPVGVKITSESLIDLSHESLMRIWDKLKIWVDEEAQAVQMYNRLAEAAALYQEGKSGLWRPPDLHLALSWRNKQKPTLTWAQRYNPAFERTMVYLETSEKEFIAEEQNKIKLQKRQLRRTRIFAIVVGSAAIVALGIMLWALELRQRAVENEKEAAKQTVIAEEQALIARKEQSKAKASQEIAEEQRKEAEKERRVAQQAQKEAESSAIIAKQQTKIAEEQAEIARHEKSKAEASAREAEKQSKIAQEKSAEAYTRRMLSISQSMAVKSLQIDRDVQLQSLVAYQAYVFNKQYQGLNHHPDIYAGLLHALKNLNQKGYNHLQGHRGGINSLAFVPGKEILFSAGGDGRLFKWSLANNKTSKDTIIQNRFINRSMTISPAGNYLAMGTSEATIQLFDLSNEITRPIVLKGHTGIVLALAFSNDEKKLYASGGSNKLIEWDVNKQTSQIISEEYKIRSLAISLNGKTLLSGTDDGKILQWNLQTKQPKVVDSEEGNTVYSLTYSNDGSIFISGHNDGKVKIWVAGAMKTTKTLGGHSAAVNAIQFSPDDSKIVTTSNDGTVQLWDAQNLNNQPIVIKEHESWVVSASFNPAGNYFITSGNRNGEMMIWPTKSETMAQNLYSKLTRDMTIEEWATYVALDIDYEKTRNIKPYNIQPKNKQKN